MNELLRLKNTKRNHYLYYWTIIGLPYLVNSPILYLGTCRFQLVIRNSYLFIETLSKIDTAVNVTFFDVSVYINDEKQRKKYLVELSRSVFRQSLCMVNLGSENQVFFYFGYRETVCKAPFIGLPNTSVYCYMNSLLQFICANRNLRAMFLAYQGDVSSELRRIYQYMLWRDAFRKIDNQFVPRTDKLLSLLQLGDQQEDVTEHLYKLIDVIEKQLSDSELERFREQKKRCYFEQLYTIYSTESDYTSVTSTFELILRVPVTGFRALQDAFRMLKTPVLFDKLITVNGRQENARRYYDYKFGNIILIQPERIVFNANSFTPEKITAKQTFPEKLSISYGKLCNGGIIYELAALVSHSGVATAGHYITYIKNDDKWYELNDMQVYEVSSKTIYSQTGENNITPYLLLYCSTDSIDSKLDLPEEDRYAMLLEYEEFHAKALSLQTRQLSLFSLSGIKSVITFPRDALLQDVVQLEHFIITVGGKIVKYANVFTKYRAMTDFYDPIEVYEARKKDQIIVDLFIPGFANDNCFIKYFSTSQSAPDENMLSNMRTALENGGVCTFQVSPNYYILNAKTFTTVQTPRPWSRIIVEFTTKVPDGVCRHEYKTVFRQSTQSRYIHSIVAYEQYLKEQATVQFQPFSDIQLSSNLSRTSDRILQLSFGDIKEAMIQNYLAVHGFDSPIACINKLPTLYFTARFSDDFESITRHYYNELLNFVLITLEDGTRITVQYLVELFAKAFHTEFPAMLTMYNDICFDDKPIFKSAGLNFLSYEQKTLQDVLRKPLTRTENSSFFEPDSENGIQCSMLMEFGAVNTPKPRNQEDSMNYCTGVLYFHYRVPLFAACQLTTLRPYRAIIVFNSQPICDYYVHLRREIDAVNVGDFQQKIYEQLYDLISHLFDYTGIKHELIFSTQTIGGLINHILDDPQHNISEFRGYPMDQNLVFRVDVVKQGKYRFISRLDANLKPHSFPLCVPDAQLTHKILTEQQTAYYAHLKNIHKKEYLGLFYHYFRYRIYTVDYFQHFKIIGSAGNITGIQADGYKVIKDIDLFKGYDKIYYSKVG